MKQLAASFLLIFSAFIASAQTTLKEHKAGHVFFISLPDYMSETYGINSSSTIQFKNVVKDVYGFVIEDTKDVLALAQMKYSSVNEFYEDFIKDFLKDEDQRKVGTPVSQKKGGTNFILADVSYFDKEAKAEIYYLAGIVETKDAFYKVLCFTSLENKDKFKPDFEKIVYSLRD